MWNRILILILAIVPWQAFSLHSESGPWVQATKGEIWPMPNSRIIKEDFYVLRPSNFDIRVSFLTFKMLSISCLTKRINLHN